MLDDLRFALRSLRKHGAFTAVAVATLALGIGANAAMFAVVNAVIFKPLPFPGADRLVRVTADVVGLGSRDIGVSAPELYDYRDRTDLFEEISGIFAIDANLTEVDEPERVELLLVEPVVLRAPRRRSRNSAGSFGCRRMMRPGIAEVVVLSDSVWKRRFGGRADAIGRKLRIDGDWFEVVGVMPPEFEHPGRALRTGVDMWAPSGYRAAPFPRSIEPAAGIRIAGSDRSPEGGGQPRQRRSSGSRPSGAKRRAEYPTVYPSRAGWTPRIVGLHEDMVGQSRTPLLMILAAVGVGAAHRLRQHRRPAAGSIGEPHSRARHSACAWGRPAAAGAASVHREPACSRVPAALAGLLLAVWTRDVIVALAPDGLPRLTEVAFDARVLLFAGGRVRGDRHSVRARPGAGSSRSPMCSLRLKDARAASPAGQAVRSLSARHRRIRARDGSPRRAQCSSSGASGS